jgi:hypothetical protein
VPGGAAPYAAEGTPPKVLHEGSPLNAARSRARGGESSRSRKAEELRASVDLEAIARARRWSREQRGEVERAVLAFGERYGDAAVAEILREIRANLAEIRMPVRYLEAALARRDAATPLSLAPVPF